ncbi:MAG: RNA-binding S4 domain-containing protein [Porphyromonas sp.]|nr:RNA-binding S4 domain-containing protein [Porphyromonas sp.]
MSSEQRIDKWLWATRVFKTRSIASDACKKGRVLVDGLTVKPSKMIHVGDRVQVRKPPVTFTFEVIGLTNNRVGAKLVENYLRNVTPQDQYEVLELHRAAQKLGRARGSGRPTKKERRDMEQFFGQGADAQWDFDSFEEEDDLGYDFGDFWDEDED